VQTLDAIPVLAATLALLTAAACNPPQSSFVDENASNPTGDPALAHTAQNTTSLAYLSSGVLALGFEDTSGAYTEEPPNSGNLVPVAGTPSRMGYAFSVDNGTHWTRATPFVPVSLACDPTEPLPGCIAQVLGTPSLAAFGSTAIYATLATSLQPDGVTFAQDTVLVASSTDGITWTDLRIAVQVAGAQLLSPNVALIGTTALLVVATGYGTPHPQILFTQSVVASGVGSSGFVWAEPTPIVPLATDDPTLPRRHPIVRMASITQAYVAYIEESGAGPTAGVDTINAKVIRIERPCLVQSGVACVEYGAWELTAPSFNEGPFEFDSVLGGALGRSWLDVDPMGFGIDDAFTSSGMPIVNLYVVFKQRVPGTAGTTDRVLFWQCADSVPPYVDCGVGPDGVSSLPWYSEMIDDGTYGSAQPNIAALESGDGVAITWLARTSNDPPDLEGGEYGVALASVYSIDHGMTLSPIQTLSPAWAPCPTPSSVGSHSAAGVFSDTIGSVVLPVTLNQVLDGSPLPASAPAIVTAFADSSGGCLSIGQVTYDQHVAAVAW
jgi:hypothetical protein